MRCAIMLRETMRRGHVLCGMQWFYVVLRMACVIGLDA